MTLTLWCHLHVSHGKILHGTSWTNVVFLSPFLLRFCNSCQLHLPLCLHLCLSCDFLSTNSIPRCTTVGYHIISIPLFTQTFLRATPKSYLMSLLFGHHQWISTQTLYSTFQPSTLHFRVRACTERSLIFITCLFHVSEFTCSYILSTRLS